MTLRFVGRGFSRANVADLTVRPAYCFATAIAVVFAFASAALAQTPRVEVTLGGVVSGRAPAGDVNATLIDSGGNALTLFKTSNRVAMGTGVEAQVAVRIRPRLLIELGGNWVKADLETRVTSDLEEAAPMTARLGLHQFTVEGSLQYRFSRRGRWDPFVRAGAGWLRELTTDRALVANGLSANLGGGIKYWVRESRPGLFGRLALRAEVRLAARHGGIAFGDAGVRLAPMFAAGLVIGR